MVVWDRKGRIRIKKDYLGIKFSEKGAIREVERGQSLRHQ